MVLARTVFISGLISYKGLVAARKQACCKRFLTNLSTAFPRMTSRNKVAPTPRLRALRCYRLTTSLPHCQIPAL
ncbi:uncharacterized protein EV420DRAFT_651320 [Desarmillaria tabescens]|uniref:Uncharacterized protein n=1 Tax=Armillaria tabescens TaxID=1929756 RepID=A0AA39NJL5_ARMTA|nr:uncharacterized protein EV420DRAFT_651320 [Desarmillaria tabescens]KAK0466839.1 hypothetical protein EV420DRAFT_651320 [Desarmillaria tabescens]